MRDRDGGATAMIYARRLAAADADQALWPQVKGVDYRAATVEEKRALAALVDHLWRGVDTPNAQLATLARDAGMTIELWTIGDAPVWIVREPRDARHGAGVYMIRAGTPAAGLPVLLEAPHAYSDMKSQLVASGAFAGDARVRGLFTSSLKRGFADVAHDPDHLYSEATRAVIATGPVAIVQLHGFDAVRANDTDDEPDVRAGGADVIVSAANRDGSTPASSAVARAVAEVLHVVVARFPEDTKELGGTTNVQARLADGVDGARFVHVEMSLAVRKSLAQDRARAAALGRAIVEALQEGVH